MILSPFRYETNLTSKDYETLGRRTQRAAGFGAHFTDSRSVRLSP